MNIISNKNRLKTNISKYIEYSKINLNNIKSSIIYKIVKKFSKGDFILIHIKKEITNNLNLLNIIIKT